MVSKFVEKKIKENMWKMRTWGNLEGKKGTRTTPGRPSVCGHWHSVVPFFLVFSPLKLHMPLPFEFLLPLVECYNIFRHEKFC